MKISCECGSTIVDITDYLSNKGHIIADQDYFAILNAIDDAIEKSGPTAKEKEAACMSVRNLISGVSILIWQCRTCGRLYVSRPDRSLEAFVPEHLNHDKNLLAGRQDVRG